MKYVGNHLILFN